MSDEFTDESGEESFEDLLNAYEKGMTDNLRVGDKIEGKIISIGKDTVFVDTGTKVDGAVEKAELLDENGELPCAPGDKLTLFVVSLDEHEIRLSRALSGAGGLEMLRDAHQGGVPVEGRVASTQKGGFNVEILKRRAFCPISQIDVKYVENPEDYVGQTFEFLIAQFEDRGKNIVVSRRKLLEKEIAETRKAFLAELEVDQQLEGVVTKLMPYGAFVELAPGVEGMVHISELSWSRVENPREAVSENQKIAVKVIGMDTEGPLEKRKISLSVKQVQNDPWESVDTVFSEGRIVEGKVTRLTKFGAFVEISPGIEGLVHISEMSHTRRVARVEDVVSAGESVEVMIKEIDPDKRRISLSIKDAGQDPWEDIDKNFPVGTKTEGIVAKKESFGYFIDLAPGITGLMPKSKIKASGSSRVDTAKVGDNIGVTVIHLEPESRKITLAPSDSSGEEENWEKFASSQDRPMGDLAAKLEKALKKSDKRKK